MTGNNKKKYIIQYVVYIYLYNENFIVNYCDYTIICQIVYVFDNLWWKSPELTTSQTANAHTSVQKIAGTKAHVGGLIIRYLPLIFMACFDGKNRYHR